MRKEQNKIAYYNAVKFAWKLSHLFSLTGIRIRAKKQASLAKGEEIFNFVYQKSCVLSNLKLVNVDLKMRIFAQVRWKLE